MPERMDAETVIREYMKWEWNNRQSKYIMNETKQIEWLGFEWEMPFWEREMCEFWMSVPTAYLKNRCLQTYHMINYLNPDAGFVHERMPAVKRGSFLKSILKSVGMVRRLGYLYSDLKQLEKGRKNYLYGEISQKEMLHEIRKHGFHYCGIPYIIDAYLRSSVYL